MTKLDRNKNIVDLFKSGIPGSSIGERFGLSGERIRQILKSNNVVKSDGGAHKASLQKKEAEKESYLKKWIPYLKCTKEEMLRITQGEAHNKYLYKFTAHKSSSKHRGISFTLTFPEWVDVWNKSGYFGNSRYVMARNGDNGGYEIGNVSIISSSQNHRDAWKYKHWGHKISASTKGIPKKRGTKTTFVKLPEKELKELRKARWRAWYHKNAVRMRKYYNDTRKQRRIDNTTSLC